MTETSGLQLEHAEFGDGQPEDAAVCGYCNQKLSRTYWQVGDKPACFTCKNAAIGPATGSGLGRFVRAFLYGSIAGGLGAGLWYGVRAATGLEIGLIAIVVGVLVGGAVRAGSRGRGGWLYQALAVFLTYSAIVSTYVPTIVGELKEAADKQEQTSTATPISAPASEPPGGEKPVSLGRGLLALVIVSVVVMGIAYAAPFLMGIQNVIGLLIISFALWEAWKINKKVDVAVSGPYRLGAPGQSEVPAEPPPPAITPGLG
jgi:hypothetical protein